MPRFDAPGRKGPQTLICYRDGREYRFPLPYQTEDPREIRILTEERIPGVPVPAPKPAPIVAEPAPPEPEPEKPKPRKGGDA